VPFVSVRHCAGAFSRAQQQQLIRDITEAFVKIGGDGIRSQVVVLVDEVADGLWGNGGEILTLESIEKTRAARAAAKQA
jgi:4-oxalocrotonate tautomerase family enzyme